MIFKRSVIYEEVAADLIDTEDCLLLLKADEVKVVCVLSDKIAVNKTGHRIYADCEKIPPKFSWATDADCMITIYEPNFSVLSPGQKKIAILRELLKIQSDSSDGTKKIKIIDYDLQDFRVIIDRFGVNWDKEPDLFSEVV